MEITKVVWSWTDEWSAHDVSSVMLPQLFLSQLEGKKTLYLFGEFTLWDPTRLSAPAQDILATAWHVASAEYAVVEIADTGATKLIESTNYDSPEALTTALGGLVAADRNYVVRLGAFSLAEQDGDILVFEASPAELESLFAAISAHAEKCGWRFIDAIDD